MTPTPIRIGFVGLSARGWASWLLAPPLFKEPLAALYTVAAVSTSKPESAATTAAHYSQVVGTPIRAYHGPTTAISADNELDLIAVAVKAPSHRAAALPVIEAGKDLYLEWPLARNVQEAEELAALARRKAIRTMVGFQGRQSPTLLKVKEMVESGALGRIYSSTVTMRPIRGPVLIWGAYTVAGSEYMADAANGATVLDVGFAHTLDYVLHALGPLASVSAITANQHPVVAVVDHAGALMGREVQQDGVHQIALVGELRRGGVFSMHFRAGLETAGGRPGKPFVWVIDGEKGTVLVEGSEDGKVGGFVHEDEPTLYLDGEKVEMPADDGLTNTARAWAQFAKGPEGEYPTLEDAVRMRKLLVAITCSAEEGKRIDL